MKIFTLAFILILTLTLLSGCKKESKYMRRIDGDWELKIYKQTDGNGFTKTIPAEGIFHFTKTKHESTGTFEYSYTWYGVNDTVTESLSGNYSFEKENKSYLLNYIEPITGINTTRKLRIDIVTTDEAILQYWGTSRIDTYILKEKSN